MKKKLLSAMLTLALAGVGVLSAETLAVAGDQYVDSGTSNYPADASVPDGVAANPDANLKSIDVQAMTTGGGEINYSVMLEWGAMQFKYDYGSTWDPVAHKYIDSNPGVKTGGWIKDDLVDGQNNSIVVTNNSNYPIDASFAYEGTEGVLNTEESADPVKGIFSTENQTLLDALDGNVADVASMYTTTLHLNMCKDNLDIGRTYYFQGTDDGEYSDIMYFSLIGKPARKLAMTEMQSVGSIKIRITPAKNVSEKVK